MSMTPRLAFVQCLSPSGLHRMAYHEWGDARNPRVLVCAHGLTRTGRDFDVLAQALCNDYRVICPDVAGRGSSEWLANPAHYAIPQYAADMVTLLARLNVESVDWFGTSMGGLIGMSLSGLPGSPIRKLLLNDIGPRITAASLTRIGAYLDLDVRFKTFDEGLAYLKTTSASFGPHTPEQWRALNTAILKPQDGEWALHYDLRLAEPFKQVSSEQVAAGEALLWKLFEATPGEVLIVRGAQSDLLTRETAQDMVRRGQRASLVEIADVGHAPTFVQPDQVAIARRFFLGT